MTGPPSATEVLARLEQEPASALAELFAAYRERLRGALGLRLDARMQGRVDPSDVIQETFIEAKARLEEYLQNPQVAPYVWIRFLALQRLAILQRFHLQAQQRDVRREVSLDRNNDLQPSSVNLAACLIQSRTTPGDALQQAELQQQLEKALERMDDTDREVLALRHFEQLNNQETAQVLGISPSAASKRYYGALKRLQEIFTSLFGDTSDIRL
jgi:RNA polymerase sigma-70 factor (ECF subfamily)